MTWRIPAVLLPLLMAGSAACGPFRDSGLDARAAMEEAFTKESLPAYVTRDAEGRQLWKQTRALYERRAYDPVWFRGTVPRAQMADLIAALRAAEDDGLEPDLYAVGAFERWRDRGSRGFVMRARLQPAEVARLDPWLSYAFMRFASDLATGLSDLAHADRRWRIRPAPFDAAAYLEDAVAQNRVRAALLALRPDHVQYRAMREMLARYRTLAAAGGWPALPRDLQVKRGQASEATGVLARRLAASGDYSGRVRDGKPIEYDQALEDALKRFQRRHGLADDGVPGPVTIAALNVPVEQRIDQIALNLERWRWLPRDLGSPHILVNIPEYQLEVWEGDRVMLTMPVVVGRPETPTPIFNHEMTYLVFSPYWNVPPGIAEGETLPAVMRDPAFLTRNNMEVLDRSGNVIDPATIDLSDPTAYRFRQRPGRQNSLGLVKFMFPNEHHVYLHDTPANSLFDRVNRPFSHGCVRVGEPAALAEYLLRDQPEWTPDRIQAAMHGGEERAVHLRAPVPVYLGYWTARIAADGDLQFRQDVYGIDRRQTALLRDRVARLRKAADAAAATIPAGDEED